MAIRCSSFFSTHTRRVYSKISRIASLEKVRANHGFNVYGSKKAAHEKGYIEREHGYLHKKKSSILIISRVPNGVEVFIGWPDHRTRM